VDILLRKRAAVGYTRGRVNILLMILLRVRVLRCYQALHACHEKLCVLKRLRRRMRSSLAAVAFVFTTVGHLFRK